MLPEDDPFKAGIPPFASQEVTVRKGDVVWVEHKPVVVTAGGYVYPNVTSVNHDERSIIQGSPEVRKSGQFLFVNMCYKSTHKTPIRLWPISVWHKIQSWPSNEDSRYPSSPFSNGI